jgi:hypothetical protein
MSYAPYRTAPPSSETLPVELAELRERVKAQALDVRTELEPLVEEVLEQAKFRSRVLTVARDALEQLRLDLDMARFDLEATRREREALKRLVDDPD